MTHYTKNLKQLHPVDPESQLKQIDFCSFKICSDIFRKKFKSFKVDSSRRVVYIDKNHKTLVKHLLIVILTSRFYHNIRPFFIKCKLYKTKYHELPGALAL